VRYFYRSPEVKTDPAKGIDRMSFRSDFFDIVKSTNPALPMGSRESVFLNTIDRGLTAQHREMGLIRQGIESSISEAADRYADASDDASQTIANEIAYQGEQVRQAVLEAAHEVSWSIDQARVYLGAQITEVRWAVERNTQATQSVLDSLWKTHWIDSRQFFDEGVQCYESAELEFARERFQKATDACRTNGFAYQYLGFLSVHDDDQTQALRYFELAAKFAPNNHHKAIAHYHLSRAWHASGNETASLDHIRLAVALAPKDFPYQFELVRALMRAGLKQDAIRELRKLILADLKYWTAAAINQSLDPMRAEITVLLGELRDEERSNANKLSEDFWETFSVVESLPESLPLAFSSATVGRWRRDAESLFEQGTIFAYREIIGAVRVLHRPIIEAVIGRYKKWISDSQASLAKLVADSQASVNQFCAERQRLIGQVEGVKSILSQQESWLKEQFKSNEHGYGFALGCGGLLALLGLVIYAGILLEYFAIKNATGLSDTLGKLLIFLPLIVILPIMVTVRWILFLGRRRGVRIEARAKELDIESKVRASEESALEAKKQAVEELEQKAEEFNRLRSIYQNNITLLERRLTIAPAR
jgi:tetratricopeptide (TPR) repeat protein